MTHALPVESMVPMTLATAAERDDTLRLLCSEIWGGNRPVQAPVSLPHLRGQLFSRPCAGGRGGDIHYLSVCGSGLLSRICLADVVGHGEAVATVSSEVHRQLRRLMNQPDQRRVLRDLNRRLVQMGFKAITTAAAISFYPPSFTLSISYAGHPPAWHYSAARDAWSRVGLEDGLLRQSGMVNLPLAVDEDTQFTRRLLQIECGDRLLVVTDGILEAPGRDGELFGGERVAGLLERARGATLERLSEELLAELRGFSPSAFDADDVTYLLLEFGERPKAPALWTALKSRALRLRGNSAAFA